MMEGSDSNNYIVLSDTGEGEQVTTTIHTSQGVSQSLFTRAISNMLEMVNKLEFNPAKDATVNMPSQKHMLSLTTLNTSSTVADLSRPSMYTPIHVGNTQFRPLYILLRLIGIPEAMVLSNLSCLYLRLSFKGMKWHVVQIPAI